jgi:CheY-like chemotaxis protein
LLHAKNGKEAIEFIEQDSSICLVLMDIKMPIMDGYTSTKLIKEKNLAIPIIAQSAYALEHEIKKYKGIFNDYITKPIQKDLLIKKISQYIPISEFDK